MGLVEDQSKAQKKFAAIQCASCAAHTYAYAAEPIVQFGADLIAWLYLYDDRVGEAPEVNDINQLATTLASYTTLLKTHAIPPNPSVFHASLLDLQKRATALGADDNWHRRFCHSLSQFHTGCLGEFPFRQANQTPSLEEYRKIRGLSIGTRPVFDVAELAQTALLSPENARRSDVLVLRTLGSELCAWVNDVYSSPKELADKDPLNLVHVIANELNIGGLAAVKEAVRMFAEELREFDSKVETMCANSDDQVFTGYVRGIAHWVHGNTNWTKECGRYW